MSSGQQQQQQEAGDPRALISRKQVQQAVRAEQGPEAHLSSWRVKDFLPKEANYVSVVTSVEATFASGGEERTTSYVVKILSGAGELFKGAPELSEGLFDKETKFYREAIPALNAELKSLGLGPLSVPKCYLADSHREIIFLEDLRLRGFQSCVQQPWTDHVHVTVMAQELARLHAASFLLKPKVPLRDLNYPEKQAVLEWLRGFFVSGCTVSEMILKHCEGYRRAEKWAAYAKENSLEIFRKFTSIPNEAEVLCHGDCWINNFLFRYNEAGEPVAGVLVDFQTYRVAHPTTDLASLVYFSLPGPERRDHLDTIVTAYYNTFNEVLEAGGRAAPFTLSGLRQEYEKTREFALLLSLLQVPKKLPTMLGETYDVPVLVKLDAESEKEIDDKLNTEKIEILKKSELFQNWFIPLFENIKDD